MLKSPLPKVVYGPIKYSYKKLDQIIKRFFERLVLKIVDKTY